MIHLPQYDHADLGLVDDDNTEDMRKPPASGLVHHHQAAEGSLNNPITRQENSMTTITPVTDYQQEDGR